MKILLIAATRMEIQPLVEFIKQSDYNSQIQLLITGVGMVSTTFKLTQHLTTNRYDVIVQFGIAGSYHMTDELGKIYQVKEDTFGDLGAEDTTQFIDIFDMELPLDDNIYIKKAIPNPYSISNLPKAKGLTVNTCSGKQTTIDMRKHKYDVDIETMEGAALHYVAHQLGCKYLQIRAISNHVIPRDRETWNMKLAIENLNNFAISWLQNTMQN